ncbi:hypothetical protein M408DRAFT_330180 [Serendipita vermifera MAFF 305830]|uniref:Partial AB-hydrolase lipase domain-containing protein n=1 Tax=Serendipita vermifera MAFF 305830 TaxID=933852 RepID=A0A0C3ARV4_SERVB|nr:hypothetical protein M408DRAFT_330180 [Serendipita vermifera MAFF 305830]
MKPAPVLPTLVTSDTPEAIETSSFNAFPAGRPSLNPSSGQESPNRPGSAHGVRIRPSTPQRRESSVAVPMSPGRSSFVGTVHDPDSFVPPMGQVDKLWHWWNKFSSFWISSTFLILVVMWATAARLIAVIPKWFKGTKPHVYAWDENAKHWEKENVVKDIAYYARHCGYDIKDETVETQDGYFLRMHRVINPRHRPGPDGRGGFPVLILHGLFQSSGSFVTSEERSLAFWLSEHGGYQVFLGNNRAVFGMGHRHLSRKDPRFWDWTIRELAMYDLPALVEWVCLATGYDKIGFIGHSQGNGVAFLSLSLGHRPELGEKLSCFIALAPAVFAGPLTHGFPFTVLNKVKWKSWQRIFGVLDYIPLMRYSYDYVPPLVFSTMGYTMFAFLFEWTDTNWLKRRKNKMFRFTPTPVSSASIFWWCGEGGFADRQCTMDVDLPQWWDERFPPLAIYYGGNDYLVAAEPLLERLATKEKHVKVIRAERVPLSEHCDFYWAADAVEWCFSSFIEDIEKTRPKTETLVPDLKDD